MKIETKWGVFLVETLVDPVVERQKMHFPVVENEIKVVSMTISFINCVNYHQEEVILILMSMLRSIPKVNLFFNFLF